MDKSVPQLPPHLGAVLRPHTDVQRYLPPGVNRHLSIFVLFKRRVVNMFVFSNLFSQQLFDLFHSLSCLLLPNLFKMPVFILWNRKCDSGDDVVNRPITVFASCVPLAACVALSDSHKIWETHASTQEGLRSCARGSCVSCVLACLRKIRV